MEPDEEDYGDDDWVVDSIHGRKREKGVELFHVKWIGDEKKTWETRESIVDHGGQATLVKFETERARNAAEQRDIAANAASNHPPVHLNALDPPRFSPAELKRREAERQSTQLLTDLLYAEPGPPTYDLTPPQGDTVTSKAPAAAQPVKAAPQVYPGRVKMLKILAIDACTKHLLLYEEMSEVPASIKAPIFLQLVRTQQMTVDHLLVLLSKDQRKLDLSVIKDIVSAETLAMVACRCPALEHLDLKHCAYIHDDLGFNKIAVNCHNLTFLDVSNVEVRSLQDISMNCRHLRVLRAVACRFLGADGLFKTPNLKQPHLEELDVSDCINLWPVQALSRLIPGICPKLKILRANCIFQTRTIREGFLNLPKIRAGLKKVLNSSDDSDPKANLEELGLEQDFVSSSWLCSDELLEIIFSSINRDSLKLLDLSARGQPWRKDPYYEVLSIYLSKAAEWTPKLRELRIGGNRLLDDEVNLPPTLTTLSLRDAVLGTGMLNVIMPPLQQNSSAIPRLRHLDLSRLKDKKLVPTYIIKIFKNTHHPLETLVLNREDSDVRYWNESDTMPTYEDDFVGVSISKVKLAPQLLLTKLDLCRIVGLNAGQLSLIVDEKVLPNLRELKFSLTRFMGEVGLDAFFTTSSSHTLPSKLEKLDIICPPYVQLPADYVFTTRSVFPSIKHLSWNLFALNADNSPRLLRMFPNLERLELVVAAFTLPYSEISHEKLIRALANGAGKRLKELRLHCNEFESGSIRELIEILKNSAVKTFYICHHMYEQILGAETTHRINQEIFRKRNMITSQQFEESLPIPGAHRLKLVPEPCVHHVMGGFDPDYYL